MEIPQADSPDIADVERRLDENWNDRKHLAEQEFDLRGEIQGLLQQRAGREALDAALARERECRAALAANNQEYDGLVQKWTAEVLGSGPA